MTECWLPSTATAASGVWNGIGMQPVRSGSSVCLGEGNYFDTDGMELGALRPSLPSTSLAGPTVESLIWEFEVVMSRGTLTIAASK
jgi:hypothetical protein